MSWRARLQKLLHSLFRHGQTDVSPTSFDKGGAPYRLVGNVERDVRHIEKMFGKSNELVVRRLDDINPKMVPTAVVFIDGLVRTTAVAEYVVTPLLEKPADGAPSSPDAQSITTLKEAAGALTYGKCLVLREGETATAFDVHQWAMRAVERAEIEPTEIGSQEGFNEDLFSNVALLRRRLRTPKLQTERLEIGTESPADVRLLYVAGIARPAIVDEVRRRLENMQIDAVVGSTTLEEMTSDTPWSPFPNSIITARPDRTAGMLLEGFVAVLVDGSPMVMVVPGNLVALFQAADDYYDHYYVASFTRAIRWLAALVGLLASPIYVAAISYQHEIIPSRLLFTIASGREGVPFPPVMEAFLMELAFELLREAGLRVPSQIGQAVSIVGVLVIGDAAVRAGLVSPLMIVIVGMTAISTFAVPSNQLSNALRLLRFPLILLGGFLGLFGVFFGLMLIIAILLDTHSFGVPYVTPFIPLRARGLIDGFIRGPMWWQQHRPWHLVQPGKERQRPAGQHPRPRRPKDKRRKR